MSILYNFIVVNKIVFSEILTPFAVYMCQDPLSRYDTLGDVSFINQDFFKFKKTFSIAVRYECYRVKGFLQFTTIYAD